MTGCLGDGTSGRLHSLIRACASIDKSSRVSELKSRLGIKKSPTTLSTILTGSDTLKFAQSQHAALTPRWRNFKAIKVCAPETKALVCCYFHPFRAGVISGGGRSRATERDTKTTSTDTCHTSRRRIETIIIRDSPFGIWSWRRRRQLRWRGRQEGSNNVSAAITIVGPPGCFDCVRKWLLRLW